MRYIIAPFWMLIFVCFGMFLIESCTSKVYSEEQLSINPAFLNIFNSLIKSDTIIFDDITGKSKGIVITKIDSIIRNSKGGFNNEVPYKLIRFQFKQIGKDSIKLERENEIFVNKDPLTKQTSIGIQFNNLFFNDTIMPPMHSDSLLLNTHKISNYYAFESTLVSAKSEDVKVLYIGKQLGFLGFKTYSGEIWTVKTGENK